MSQYNDELYHHGILGQKWGVTNGPPYPLKEGDHSAAEQKMARRSTRQERIAARRARKQQKHEIKMQKKAAKAEHKRQEILRKGDAKAVSKLKGNISNDEYREVFQRLQNERYLDELTSSQMKEVSAKINSMKNILSNIKTSSDAAIDFYNNGASIYNTIIKAKQLDGKMLDKKEMQLVPRKQKGDGDKKNDKKD